jgi:hypothetical protein
MGAEGESGGEECSDVSQMVWSIGWRGGISFRDLLHTSK